MRDLLPAFVSISGGIEGEGEGGRRRQSVIERGRNGGFGCGSHRLLSRVGGRRRGVCSIHMGEQAKCGGGGEESMGRNSPKLSRSFRVLAEKYKEKFLNRHRDFCEVLTWANPIPPEIYARAQKFRSVARPRRGRFRCPVSEREREVAAKLWALEQKGKGIGFHEISLGDNVAAGEGGREGGRILLFLPPLRLRVAGFFFPAHVQYRERAPSIAFLCVVSQGKLIREDDKQTGRGGGGPSFLVFIPLLRSAFPIESDVRK